MVKIRKGYVLFCLSLVAVATLPMVNGKLSSLVPAVIAQNTDARKAEADQLLQQRIQQAIESLQKSLATNRMIHSREGESIDLGNLGIIFESLGQYQKAIDFYQQSLAIAREIRDRKGEAISLGNLGAAYQSLGQYKKATDYQQQSLAIIQEIGYRDIESYRKYLALTRENGYRKEEGIILFVLGNTYNFLGNYQKGIEFYQQSLAIMKNIGDRAGEANSLGGLGLSYYSLGQYQKAIEYLEQSLAILNKYDSNGDGLFDDFINIRPIDLKTIILFNLGNAYYSLGQYQKAIDYLRQSESLYTAIGTAAQRIDRGREYAFIPAAIARTFTDQFDLRRETDRIFNEALALYSEPVELIRPLSINEKSRIKSVIENLKKALIGYQKLGDKPKQEFIFSILGDICIYSVGNAYYSLGQYQKPIEYYGNTLECLNFYQQALTIHQSQYKPLVENRVEESAYLLKIGRTYAELDDKKNSISYLQKGILILDQLAMDKTLSEFTKSEYILFIKGNSLQALCQVYVKFDEKQKALDCYNQMFSLPVRFAEVTRVRGNLEVGDLYMKEGNNEQALTYYLSALSEFIKTYGQEYKGNKEMVLSKIGIAYKMLNRPSEALSYLEQSANLIIESRRDVPRKYREKHWGGNVYVLETFPHLIDLLIQQNQPEKAFEWSNLATTADLADYNRLINAKVADPDAQKALDNWNADNQQLEGMRRQLQDKYSEELAQQIRQFEEKVYKNAETIGDKYPEIAELFETKPTDIAQLQKNIAPDTLVIQPVPLRDKVALFLVTREKLIVIQSDTKREEFNQLVSEYRTQLPDYKNADYLVTGSKLYEILIRPIESQIATSSPKNIAIIATGQLRYIPFETLYDKKNDQVLLEKYPIYYLTRISTSTPPATERKPLQGLAFANPKPTQEELKGTEIEAETISKIFPGSEKYLGINATLDIFKKQAFRFSILHLGTHGCFNLAGCPNLGMQANTILFANKEQYNIADAALLGLKNTELITLSACQTAKEANADGQEISGLAYVLERAGAKSVIASLWSAEDNTSAEIMTQFYQNLKNGMSKSEAMQKAKLSQIKSHPFFWSPFILIGDAN
ncbi:MAG: CHAT domain-containing protein [Microcystis sp. M025S2]|uniref:CHAT domain-containing protein n=1 Tax=unclassified Microcystis TaxID=2643300 RepID=UPI00258DEFCB|nr:MULTISPECIES: CHAT domain-containing protein [unclassified Microcystis]MCA2710390.1 CHAT domain-containing protein [Microcystis sp. M025S2]MCA2759484.1 CHAT domain-containing protein [Microcystis sp. M145S2]